MGKSTTLYRLLGSWALGVHASRPAPASNPQAASHDELEGSRLHEYMLVLFLRVRELNGGDLVANLLSNLVHDRWQREEGLVRCIDENSEKVLLLVDGYDEGDGEQKKSVDKWLAGRGCQGITIIVTSRPGFCRPSPPPDTTYALEGLDQTKQRSYAQQFDELMGVEPGQKSAAEQLEELPFQHLDFLQFPLMLALVCFLARQGQSVLPQSVTGLYNMFVQFMSEKAMRDPINFSEEHLSKLLKLLQKVAFDLFGLKQSEITPDILSKHLATSETMIDLCKFGLVCQEIKLKGLTNSQTGTFLHQSFLDYFAARHFVSLSKEERSALLGKIAIHENLLVLVAGLFEENEEHRACFRQMMKAWKRSVKRARKEKGKLYKRAEWYDIDHSVRHACLLWVGELQDPAWLRADHVTDINQMLGGITLHGDCTASCFRGVTTLVRCAAHHHDSLSSHSPQQRPSPLQRILSALSRQRPSLPSREPLNLRLSDCRSSAVSALHDLLHLSLPPNVKLTCESLTLPDCLTGEKCERLAAVLLRLNDLESLDITVSSLTALTAVSVGFNSTSRLRLLRVHCSPSSSCDSSSAAAEPWSPSDELINNICRLSALGWIELCDYGSTLTTETRRDINRRLTARLTPRVKVEIYEPLKLERIHQESHLLIAADMEQQSPSMTAAMISARKGKVDARQTMELQRSRTREEQACKYDPSADEAELTTLLNAADMEQQSTSKTATMTLVGKGKVDNEQTMEFKGPWHPEENVSIESGLLDITGVSNIDIQMDVREGSMEDVGSVENPIMKAMDRSASRTSEEYIGKYSEDISANITDIPSMKTMMTRESSHDVECVATEAKAQSSGDGDIHSDPNRVAIHNRVTENRRFAATTVGHEGGCLTLMDTTIFIPIGAVPKGTRQQIVLGCSTDCSDLPPLRDGQRLATSVIHCLPHGIQFDEFVVIRIGLESYLRDDDNSKRIKIMHSSTNLGHEPTWRRLPTTGDGTERNTIVMAIDTDIYIMVKDFCKWCGVLDVASGEESPVPFFSTLFIFARGYGPPDINRQMVKVTVVFAHEDQDATNEAYGSKIAAHHLEVKCFSEAITMHVVKTWPEWEVESPSDNHQSIHPQTISKTPQPCMVLVFRPIATGCNSLLHYSLCFQQGEITKVIEFCNSFSEFSAESSPQPNLEPEEGHSLLQPPSQYSISPQRDNPQHNCTNTGNQGDIGAGLIQETSDHFIAQDEDIPSTIAIEPPISTSHSFQSRQTQLPDRAIEAIEMVSQSSIGIAANACPDLIRKGTRKHARSKVSPYTSRNCVRVKEKGTSKITCTQTNHLFRTGNENGRTLQTMPPPGVNLVQDQDEERLIIPQEPHLNESAVLVSQQPRQYLQTACPNEAPSSGILYVVPYRSSVANQTASALDSLMLSDTNIATHVQQSTLYAQGNQQAAMAQTLQEMYAEHPLLPVKVRVIICTGLDRTRPDYNDWRALSEKLQFSYFNGNIENLISPTNHLLNLWESLRKPVGHLMGVLREIGRYDVAEAAEESLSQG